MTSVLGLICGILVVVLGAVSDNDPLSSLFSLTACIIVLGGTLAALMVQFLSLIHISEPTRPY